MRVALDRVDHGAEEDVGDDEEERCGDDFEDVGDGAVCGGCVEAPVAVEGDVEEVVSVEDGDFFYLFEPRNLGLLNLTKKIYDNFYISLFF